MYQFMFNVAFFVLGLVVLLYGASMFTSNASRIAKALGVSELVIGLTLVAFSTSLPELAVSVTASFAGSAEIAIGNVIGSNISNIGLILGISAFLGPIAISKSEFSQGITMLLITAASALLILGGVTRLEGLFLFLFIIIFLINLLKKGPEEKIRETQRVGTRLLLLSVGVAGVIAGSRLLVFGATNIARSLNVSELFIAVTIVAIGTSLPELATSATAAMKGLKKMAIGNIIGSNVFNLAAVLGVSSMVRPIMLTNFSIPIDLLFMVGLSAILLIYMRSERKLSIREGTILLFLYALFLASQVLR